MAITRRGGFPISVAGQGTNPATLSVTTAGLGDILIAAGRVFATGITTSISGGGVTTWTKLEDFDDVTNSVHVYLYMAIVTSVNTSTVSVTLSSGTPNCEIVLDEFTAGLGAGTPWAVDGSQHAHLSNASSTTVTWPSLTASAVGELYWGYTRNVNTGTGGATSGYTYNVLAGTGNMCCFNPSAPSGSATQPTATQSPAGTSDGVAAILTTAAAVATGELTATILSCYAS